MMYQSTLAILIFLAILTVFVPRKYFLLPYIIAACFVPVDQRIMIADLDFPVIRILMLVSVVRIILRGERRTIEWNIFDKMVLSWAVCGSVVYVMLHLNMRAVIYKCGAMYDLIGLYWIFRQHIQSWKDIVFTIKIFSLCALGMVPIVAAEWLTGNSPLASLGVVRTLVREGRFRCQASFPHPIMFGSFWAALVPLFLAAARVETQKKLLYSAAVASIFAVIASASSTPIMGLFAGLVALCAFKWRRYTRQAVMALLLMVICLHIIMEAPVWHLMARVRLVGGATGWHRYKVVEEAINHFDEWALLGCLSTQHWGWRLWDITNQYVSEGVRGGIFTLGLFIALLILSFKTLTQLSQRASNPNHQLLAWGFSATLFAHCVIFFGAAYFGQIGLSWYLLLAIIGFLATENKKTNKQELATLSQVLIR